MNEEYSGLMSYGEYIPYPRETLRIKSILLEIFTFEEAFYKLITQSVHIHNIVVMDLILEARNLLNTKSATYKAERIHPIKNACTDIFF